MKKLLAGILAIAAVLSGSVGASAAAATKNVTKNYGEISYDVSANLPKVTLNLVMPSTIKAALNPYGVGIKIEDAESWVTNTMGIVSLAYPIVNKSTDYGVYFDAVAYTSTSGEWQVTKTAVQNGIKGANMSLTAANTAEDLADEDNYSNTASAASGSAQGNLPLDSTAANGRTSQEKFAYIPAATADTPQQKIFIGFTGKLADDSAATPVKWTENDSINVNVILRVFPAPKKLT